MRSINLFIEFLTVLYRQRYVVAQLTKRDFKNKYLSSYIGLPWVFVQPAVFILVLWFVITFGLRATHVSGDLPYVAWLICGIVPWFFLSESITASTASLLEYSFLIKKIKFRPSIIPLIKILAALIIHLFFIGFIVIFAVSHGYYPSIYWLQIVYYLFAAIVLVTGIGWLASSINVFVRDVGQFVNATMTIFFWFTPIIWHLDALGGRVNPIIVYMNPFYFIVNGYRETFFTGVWFFEHPWLNLYFWLFTTGIFVLGASVFRRLVPHFADVL